MQPETITASDDLKRFIDGLLHQQQSQAGDLSPRQRSEVAQGLGLELASLEAEGLELFEAGKALAEEEAWDEAIDRLFDAASVHPRRADVVLALTQAVHGRFMRRREGDDRALGESLAARLVDLDPELQEQSEGLLEAFQSVEPRRERVVPKSAAIILIVGMLFLMMMMIILSVLVVE